MMMMVMVTNTVNFCDDDCYLVMKVTLVKEVMSCDVSPVAMLFNLVVLEILLSSKSVMKVSMIIYLTLKTVKTFWNHQPYQELN